MIDPKTIVAAGISLAGGIGGSVGYVYANFTPADTFAQHVAQDRTRAVLDLVGVLERTPPGDVTRQTLCNALQEEIAQICMDSPSHPFCVDRTALMAKAGCR